jgi:hypothetical protein
MSDLTARVESLYQQIEQAAQRAGRRSDEITPVAVTKTHPLETVIQAYRAGLRHFGENRATEGRGKAIGLAEWLDREEGLSAPNRVAPTWHLIGHLQSRQVDEVLGIYRVIHSVDSLKLAERINRLAERDQHPPIEVLLQCNVSGEASKAGFELDRWVTHQAQFGLFVTAVEQIANLPKITIRGLMTMAPWFDNPEEARPTFQSLAALQKKLTEEMPQLDWAQLSMGMSDDFEVAIEEGATIIRVGRAIFGER